MYNSRTLIAHDLNTGTNSLEQDVEDWNALAVSGSTLCTLKDVRFLIKLLIFMNIIKLLMSINIINICVFLWRLL